MKASLIFSMVILGLSACSPIIYGGMPTIYPIALHAEIETQKPNPSTGPAFFVQMEIDESALSPFLNVQLTFFDDRKELEKRNESENPWAHRFTVQVLDPSNLSETIHLNLHEKPWQKKEKVLIEVSQVNNTHHWSDTVALPKRCFRPWPTYFLWLKLKENRPKEPRVWFKKYRRVIYID